MVSDKSRRYDNNMRPLSAIRGMRSEYDEGDVPKGSPINVGGTMATALVCFFDCSCCR